MRALIIINFLLFVCFSCNNNEASKEFCPSAHSSEKESATPVEDILLKRQKSNSLNQIIIPLDNDRGVPFNYDKSLYGYIIEGFDVDENGKLFFLGGDTATLVSYSNGKEVFRKKYDDFLSNAIHSWNNKLYVYDYKFNRQNLFVLDPTTGELQKKIPKIIDNIVNNYYFQDSVLILRVFNMQEKIDLDTELAHVKYDLEGLFIEPVQNIYDLPEIYSPLISENEYMGKWNEYFLFWQFDYNTDEHIFILKDNTGEFKEEKKYTQELIGRDIYGLSGMPQEHRKLRNGKVYILGRKGDNAIVTIIPLEELFPEI